MSLAMSTKYSILLIALVIFVRTVIGTGKGPGDAEISFDPKKVFDVNLENYAANDPRSKGNCAKWKHQISEGYLEAVHMASYAHEALDEVEKLMPHPGDQENYYSWLKVAQPFWLTFFKNPDAGMQQRGITFIKREYANFWNWHKAEGHTRPNEVYYLRCDDDFMTPLGPNSPDPRDKDTEDEGKYTLAKPRKGHEPFPKGAYYAENLLPDDRLIDPEDLGGDGRDPMHPICPREIGEDGEQREGYSAEVVEGMNWRLIVLCPVLLNQPHWSVDELAQRTVLGTDITAFGQTLAKTLVHEMSHYVNKRQDPDALDNSGRPYRNADGEAESVWGWVRAWVLARYNPEQAATGPENLAYYALMTYLDQFYWGTAKAERAPTSPATMAYLLMTPPEQARHRQEQAAKSAQQQQQQQGGQAVQQQQQQGQPQGQTQGQRPRPNVNPEQGSSKKPGKLSSLGRLFGGK